MFVSELLAVVERVPMEPIETAAAAAAVTCRADDTSTMPKTGGGSGDILSSHPMSAGETL